jgi:uncharacterized protein
MDKALAAVRRVFAEEGAGESEPVCAEPRSPHEDMEVETPSGAGLLSREATAAVSSAVNRLTQNVKRHAPTLEEVVREALRPTLQSWVDENLSDLVERMVQAEIERVIRRR